MRFNVERICELAGLGAASGGLLSEAATPAPAKPAAPAAPAARAPMKAPPAPAAKPGAMKPPAMEMGYMEEDEDSDEGYHMHEMSIDDGEVYEIDETELMEALVSMRQNRLEESRVRDAVRDEIARALSNKDASWIYGSNKPSASHVGQVARGGFGFGFGFKR